MRDQRLWTWHLAAGVVILLFLGLHMVVMHLQPVISVFNPAPGKPIDWANVAARGRSVFFLVSYIVLLGSALFHGFYGLRNILFELNPGGGVKRAISGLLVTSGVILFAIGTWAAYQAFAVAQSAAGQLAGN